MIKKKLNNKVNTWAKNQFSIDTNVNLEPGLEQLINLKAPSDSGESNLAIVEKLDDDRYQASNIESAKHIIDYTWDNLFQY